jgi:hypothetical protein
MVEQIPGVTLSGKDLHFAESRVAELLRTLELMAAGDTGKRLPVSASHDELDAIAYGINVLVGELAWNGARARGAGQRAAELRDAVTRPNKTPPRTSSCATSLMRCARPSRPCWASRDCSPHQTSRPMIGRTWCAASRRTAKLYSHSSATSTSPGSMRTRSAHT